MCNIKGHIYLTAQENCVFSSFSDFLYMSVASTKVGDSHESPGCNICDVTIKKLDKLNLFQVNLYLS